MNQPANLDEILELLVNTDYYIKYMASFKAAQEEHASTSQTSDLLSHASSVIAGNKIVEDARKSSNELLRESSSILQSTTQKNKQADNIIKQNKHEQRKLAELSRALIEKQKHLTELQEQLLEQHTLLQTKVARLKADLHA